MPHELPIQIFEADVPADLVIWGYQAQSQNAIGQGAVATVYEEEEEG